MTNRFGDNLIHFGANEELVRALVRADVRFVVVGGLAVSWHCQERTADDMDLLIEPTAENSKHISQALSELGLSGFTASSFEKPGLQVPLKQTYYAELLTPEAQATVFSEVEAKAVKGKLFGFPVRIAAVADIVVMKKRAVDAAKKQCEKHMKDIDLLEQHGA